MVSNSWRARNLGGNRHSRPVSSASSTACSNPTSLTRSPLKGGSSSKRFMSEKLSMVMRM